MDQAVRNQLQRATQDARQLLEAEFAEQLEGTYDILPDGMIHDEPGPHLNDRQHLTRQKLVDAIQHRIAGGKTSAEAVADYTREAAFTFLNRFVALKMLEARELVQQCISKGELSSGFKEFTGLAPGLAELPDKGYRLYLECLFDELSIEVKILFDRQDVASLLWPRRQALDGLLATLNQTDLDSVWDQDETIGWVYQYFNRSEERKKMREESAAPRNSHELAVRNQFFTPRYVVEFLTDNTLGRIWYEMRKGETRLTDKCRYLVRRPREFFLTNKYLGMLDPPEPPGRLAAALSGDFAKLPEKPSKEELAYVATAADPVSAARVWGTLSGQEYVSMWYRRHEATGKWEGQADELWALLFAVWALWSPEMHHDAWDIYASLQGHFADPPSDLSQEELLRHPVLIPHRAKKDPRDLKILDPACGSGHFLLYCFDLLLTIYEEAWQDEQSPKSEITGKTICEDYPMIEALREAVPGLILRHNLHGIEIDARCAQIAAFALWMQAQRAYSDLGLSRDARPPIRKTNIAIAEPMPGEPELLKEFTATLNPPLLGKLVEVTFEKMKLAGEAGSLLKIEEEIRDSITEAHQQWGKTPEHLQMNLFGLQPARQDKLDFSGITDDAFWRQAEERIYEALHGYMSRMSNGQTFSRQLFADDAARGFAFVDLCRKHYDVVLMNPPFGEVPLIARDYIGSKYTNSKSDIGMAFIACLADKLEDHGRLGAITNRVFVANETLDTWRADYILGAKTSLNVLLDLGYGVLDGAMVETAAFLIDRTTSAKSSAIFVSALNARDKESAVSGLLCGQSVHHGGSVFIHRLDCFHAMPGHVLAYQLPSSLAHRLTGGVTLTGLGGKTAVGLQPSDDFRFVRLAWEIPSKTIGRSVIWCYYAKGGEYQPYWDDIHLVVKWADDGAEIRNFFNSNGKIRSRPQNLPFYFKAGVTWPERTTSDFSPRVLPQECIFRAF